MDHQIFDRDRLKIKSLSERKNSLSIDNDMVPVNGEPVNLSGPSKDLIRKITGRIKEARVKNKSVILAFGAHTIKNGLAPVIMKLIRNGWITHLATNGASIIHDWEFAFQGKTGENVRENIRNGEFGIWDETGFFINLALITGAYEGLGYGESIGRMIAEEGLHIPELAQLAAEGCIKPDTVAEKASAAIDLYGAIKKYKLKEGFMRIPHPYKEFSLQADAFTLKIPFTGHPMFGHDIIYCHPMNHGAALGRTALKDFLSFTASVSNLEEGVYISLGSAVMSPMIFEKALSMAQNIEIQHNNHITRHFIIVVDLAKNDWDWIGNGEPPADNPSYYLRYCKTFSRMGGEMHYLTADNRDFLLELYHDLA
jgi:hypothetical protein